MSRFTAWHGQPVLVGELLLDTKHGLIDQSMHRKRAKSGTGY